MFMRQHRPSFSWIAAVAALSTAGLGACVLSTEGRFMEGNAGAGGPGMEEELAGTGGHAGSGDGTGGQGGSGGNGAGATCNELGWSQRVARTRAARQPAGLVTDAAGNIILASAFRGTLTTPEGSFEAGAEGDVLIAKFDTEGAPLWAKPLGAANPSDNGREAAHSIALDGEDIVVTGLADVNIDFGGGTSVLDGGRDNGFVLKLNAAGEHLWSKGYNDVTGRAIAARGGAVAMAGVMKAAFTPGDGVSTLPFGGGEDAVVLLFDSVGQARWGRSFGDSSNQRGFAVAIDSTGAVIAGGEMQGTTAFSQDTTLSAINRAGFLVKLTSTGETAWAELHDGPNDQGLRAVAVDRNDDIIVAGEFRDSVDIDGMRLQASGGWDIYLAKLSSGGELLWAKRLGESNDQYVHAVALDEMGNIYLSGRFRGQLTLNDTFTLNAGSRDSPFVAVFGANGEALRGWCHPSNDRDQAVTAIAVDRCDKVVIAGTFDGHLDLGQGALPEGTGDELFLAKLRSIEPSLSP
ncbi:uncharacterized protein CMC5_073930 [Chondromyces crocatus]|uniref:Uncharacterized protein n=2 Tax=Chondromyces crocatus TaxID=52 RepID=A0A0K1ERD1_CHOCO|nr:uncharacterized protein CMC5_073930 [Chondromyces crocatus]